MPAMFEKIIGEIEEKSLDVHGIEIFWGGKTVLKHSFSPEKRYPIYSAVKSFTSTAVGLAAGEGRLSVNSYLYEFLDRKYIECVPSGSLADFKKITLKRLLTMSVEGYPFRPSGEDWLEFALSLPIDYGKQSVFSYSNIPAMLTAIACENAVGKHLIDYLEPRLFEPLGIISPTYTSCPQGNFYGASGMELTVHELSLLGRLYLQRGVFGGERILSEDWVSEAVSEQISNSEGGYGYFFWHTPNGFRISGKWGQKCLVYPESGLMITYLANLPERAGEMLGIAENFAENIIALS